MSLLQGIVTDVKMLIGQQIRLAIHELQLEGTRVIRIVATAIITSILGALCLFFLLLTAAAALHEIAGLALWMSSGVIALLLIVAAGGFLFSLKRNAQCLKIVPVDAQWIKEWIASPRT
jgi:hypothetical protein